MDGVSAIVINWNGGEGLLDCVRSLYEQTWPPAEVVIVDNDSADDSISRVRTEFPAATVIAAGSNLGFAAGCNLGLEHSSQRWVALLNNDAVAPADWISRLLSAVDVGPANVGMLQSRIVFADDDTRTNSTGVLFRGDATFIDRDFEKPADCPAREDVFCVSAGAALYRRSMLDALRLGAGPFDGDFFMYFEDVDLGWRARLAGWQARFVDGAPVRHALHGSAARHGDDFVGLQCRRNRLRMLARNGSSALLVRTLPRTLFDVAASIYRGGGGELTRLVRAWRGGRARRGDVNTASTVPRRNVEARWIGREG